jgi:hypothetical protein
MANSELIPISENLLLKINSLLRATEKTALANLEV